MEKVHTAGEQAPNRDVSDESTLDRGAQRREHGVFPVTLGPVGPVVVPGEVRLPIRRAGALPIGFDGQQRPGRNLAHTAKDRQGRGHHGVKRHVVVQRDGVDPGIHPAAGQQRRQRRRESDPVTVFGQVQGLDAQSIPTEQHPTAVTLDDGKREHAFEVTDEIVAPAVVGLD
jgi:hypothetical protein